MMSAPRTVLVLADRGTLPFEGLHGEPLYLHALRALVDAYREEAMVIVDDGHRARVRAEVDAVGLPARVVDSRAWWDELARLPARDVLVHDALCPLTSAQFLRDVRERATGRPGCSFISFRPVTDTVKTVVQERISGTIDRDELVSLTSPALLAASTLKRATSANRRPPLRDFADLVTWLRRFGDTELVKAPSLARRVDDPSAVKLLECLDEIRRQVRVEPGERKGPDSSVTGG